MDFLDAQALHTTHEEAALGLQHAEKYLEASSYGQLDIEFVPHHTWLRAEMAHSEYVTQLAIGSGLGRHERPALISEGVLVYVVDALIGSGDLPMRLAGDSGNGQVDGFPVLVPGESVTMRGYTITVTADDGDTHIVSINRTP